MGFENGRCGLLQLQEERRAVTRLEQRNETTSPNAPDSNDLASDIDQREPVEEQAMFE